MNIRYFALKSKPIKKFIGEGIFIAETKDAIVIPRKKERVYMSDAVYKVYDICYIMDFKSDYNEEVYTSGVEITLIEIENFK